jgi:hypothetical protein
MKVAISLSGALLFCSALLYFWSGVFSSGPDPAIHIHSPPLPSLPLPTRTTHPFKAKGRPTVIPRAARVRACRSRCNPTHTHILGPIHGCSNDIHRRAGRTILPCLQSTDTRLPVQHDIVAGERRRKVRLPVASTKYHDSDVVCRTCTCTCREVESQHISLDNETGHPNRRSLASHVS